ncbi:MAG: hypothetical protein AAF585_01625 [Verrucomicrobiota bacterium]
METTTAQSPSKADRKTTSSEASPAAKPAAAKRKKKGRFGWLNRKVHYWGAILCAIPVLIIICTGILLLHKK